MHIKKRAGVPVPLLSFLCFYSSSSPISRWLYCIKSCFLYGILTLESCFPYTIWWYELYGYSDTSCTILCFTALKFTYARHWCKYLSVEICLDLNLPSNTGCLCSNGYFVRIQVAYRHWTLFIKSDISCPWFVFWIIKWKWFGNMQYDIMTRLGNFSKLSANISKNLSNCTVFTKRLLFKYHLL